jgi:DNA-binding XRE family transcriptional regulator
MKIEIKRRPRANGKSPAIAQRATVNGKRMVMLEECEYDRLLQKADEWEPLLPEKLPDGNYPAVEYLRASLARKIIRDRRRLGLTQVELARRAGIRPETLNRVEQGKRSPSIATVEKIDRALREAEEG